MPVNEMKRIFQLLTQLQFSCAHENVGKANAPPSKGLLQVT